MSYKTRRYEQGLSGKKPGWVHIDEEGHQAQEAGYRDHLRNEDLADQIRQAHEWERDRDSSYEAPPVQPLFLWQKILWVCISLALLYAACRSSVWLAHQQHGRNFDWGTFVMSMLFIPGGIFFWPAVVLLSVALTDK